jgi:hypothetical protein
VESAGLLDNYTCWGGANEGTTLTRRVRDVTGAVILGAACELTAGGGTGAQMRIQTDASGLFTFSGLTSGHLCVESDPAGFRVFKLRGIGVQGTGMVNLPDLLPAGGSERQHRGRIARDPWPRHGDTPSISNAEVVLFCEQVSRGNRADARRATQKVYPCSMKFPPGSYELLVRRRRYSPQHAVEDQVQPGRESV